MARDMILRVQELPKFEAIVILFHNMHNGDNFVLEFALPTAEISNQIIECVVVVLFGERLF